MLKQCPGAELKLHLLLMYTFRYIPDRLHTYAGFGYSRHGPFRKLVYLAELYPTATRSIHPAEQDGAKKKDPLFQLQQGKARVDVT